MTAAAEPQARLSTLPRADGSATYSHGGYTITASANGPLEVQRRDEDPDEAYIDVVVRPAAGVGGPSERHLESLLQKTLQEIVLVQDFPRCMIQVVLQIQSVPENDYVNAKLNHPGLNLVVLPALVQTAVLALLSASIPLQTTATAASVTILPAAHPKTKTNIVTNPSPRDASQALSTHVFAFSARDYDDELLLAESEGAFTMEEWDAVLDAARAICCKPRADANAMDLLDDGEAADGSDMRKFIRSTVQGSVEEALKWRTAT